MRCQTLCQTKVVGQELNDCRVRKGTGTYIKSSVATFISLFHVYFAKRFTAALSQNSLNQTIDAFGFLGQQRGKGGED